MFELSLFASVCAIFIFAGIIKGIVGNGLPVISIAMLTLVFGLQEAIAIAVIPAFATNFWQASHGGYLRQLVRRLWPYLVCSIIAVLAGTKLLIAANPSILIAILGLLIGFYAVLGVAGREFAISPAWENFAGPMFGAFTGLIAGMTGSPAYPGMYFLNGLGFSRNQLVQALGISFSVVTLTVAISMKSNNLLSLEQFILSLSAIVPAMIGMMIGTRIRHKISEELFKKLFYTSMLTLGIYLVFRSILRLILM
jgi:uncharacterized membrane protein YfcA